MTSILDENLQVISVSELNLNARNILENKFHNVAISGEISNFNHHSSGHMYFSLKDDDASNDLSILNIRNIKKKNKRLIKFKIL